MRLSKKRVASGVVVGVVLVVGLFAFFEVPVIHINGSGRAFFLGQAVTPTHRRMRTFWLSLFG
jgi:hypothetical protein